MIGRPGRLARSAAVTLALTMGIASAVSVVGAVGGGAAGVASAASKPTMPGMSGAGMVKMKAASTAAAKAVPKPTSTIVIKNFAFSPGAISVTPGEKVRVTNRDTVVHTVTSVTGTFDTGNIAPGKTVVFTAPRRPGTYPYRCNIHQYMTGKLVVARPPRSHAGSRKTHR